ncbi:hypothetical protein KVT40_005346 [Elsinoe batatas]|uniref:C2H2-type domain-containing protein n=1 Tax=Elsinoe batatas TaxID=2601811 RepID=A0A8K0PE53_9PEZI|nr:hypothetical protein KVT40_005346 [Elsinoe batatas]
MPLQLPCITHLKLYHELTTGYGCGECDNTHAEAHVVEQHLDNAHGIKRLPKSASVALCSYYSAYHAAKLGEASSSRIDSPSKNSEDAGVPTSNTVDTEPLDAKVTQHDSRRFSAPPVTVVGRPCTLCKAYIMTNFPKAVIGHYLAKHSIVIRRNPLFYIGKNRPHDHSGIDSYKSTITKALDDLEITAEMEPFGQREGMEENKIDMIGDQTGSNSPAPPKAGALRGLQSVTQTAASTSYEDLMQTFLECIPVEHASQFHPVAHAYRTIHHGQQIYRAAKQLDLSGGLRLEHHVFAKQENGIWHCQIPCCGAVFLNMFSIDLHLFAHGEQTLSGSFCGEESCRRFDARASHLDEEHGGSAASFEAVRPRRVGEGLQKILARYGAAATIMEAGSEPSIIYGPRYLKPLTPHEIETNFLKFTGTVDDATFEQYCRTPSDGRRFCKYVTFTGKEPAINHPYHIPVVTVETIMGAQYMHLRVARRYVAWIRSEIARHNLTDFLSLQAYLRSDVYLDDTCRQAPEDSTSDSLPAGGDYVPREVLSFDEDPLYRDEERSLLGKAQLSCPWAGCEKRMKKHEHTRGYLSQHFINAHLGGFWHCHESSCEFVVYTSAEHLERHRRYCHIGPEFQCGHLDCNQVRVHDVQSSAHLNDFKLQKHHEWVFNKWLADGIPKLQDSQPDSHGGGMSALIASFSGEIDAFFSSRQRQYRSTMNRAVLTARGISLDQCDVQGMGLCQRFHHARQWYRCPAKTMLDLDTSTLIYVESHTEFTFALCCDFCATILSRLPRPKAQIPSVHHFFARKSLRHRPRFGAGANINDYQTFISHIREKRRWIPPTIAIFKQAIQHDPKQVFIVDFETTIPWGMRSVPLEVTVRTADGSIVVSCGINEPGITNSEFEDSIGVKQGPLFQQPERALRHLRRFRGARDIGVPPRCLSSKEIFQLLQEAGFGPQSYWIEYSFGNFDRKAMSLLLLQAGADPECHLPISRKCWTVIPDIMRSLPGLQRFTLQHLGRIMCPDNPHLQSLHSSASDTHVLLSVVTKFLVSSAGI